MISVSKKRIEELEKSGSVVRPDKPKPAPKPPAPKPAPPPPLPPQVDATKLTEQMMGPVVEAVRVASQAAEQATRTAEVALEAAQSHAAPRPLTSWRFFISREPDGTMSSVLAEPVGK